MENEAACLVCRNEIEEWSNPFAPHPSFGHPFPERERVNAEHALAKPQAVQPYWERCKYLFRNSSDLRNSGIWFERLDAPCPSSANISESTTPPFF